MESIQSLLKFGIINIDKPSGPTSFQVSNYVKTALKTNKTSHFGTLDPQVSGVLPIALGRACRLSDFFMHKNKTYVGIMRIHKEIPLNELNEIISKFIGKISQLPPVKSSVKRAIRTREVFSFNIIEIEDKDILFQTEVEAGTYIRKICDDIGKEIGGAHMLELRRIQAGMFLEKDSYTLYDLDKAIKMHQDGDDSLLRKMIIPADSALKEFLSFHEISSQSIKKILTGKPLMKSDLIGKEPKEELYAISHNKKFVAVVQKSHEGDIIARPLFVFN